MTYNDLIARFSANPDVMAVLGQLSKGVADSGTISQNTGLPVNQINDIMDLLDALTAQNASVDVPTPVVSNSSDVLSRMFSTEDAFPASQGSVLGSAI